MSSDRILSPHQRVSWSLLVCAAAAIALPCRSPALGDEPPAATAAPAATAPAATAAAAAATQPAYHPSLGDLMTMAVQPRHTKLGLAGRAGNWTYAAYELSELRNAFARIARTIPTYNGHDMAQLFAAMTSNPLEALKQAVAAGSASQFAAAYGQLTDACNSCHRSLQHAAVVIKIPAASSYPDQEFRPAQRNRAPGT